MRRAEHLPAESNACPAYSASVQIKMHFLVFNGPNPFHPWRMAENTTAATIIPILDELNMVYYLGYNLVSSARTPPEKPLYCCKKGCCSQFRAGDSRMRFLKDSCIPIKYQILFCLWKPTPKKTIVGSCYRPFLILLLRTFGRRCWWWLGRIWTSTFLVCFKSWTTLCLIVLFSEGTEVSWIQWHKLYEGMPILGVLGSGVP